MLRAFAALVRSTFMMASFPLLSWFKAHGRGAVIVASLAALAGSGCGLAVSAGGLSPVTDGTGGDSSASATASGGVGGAGGGSMGVGGNTSTGAGGASDSTPYLNGSYSYLCGGSNPACVPGTEDCTPGGDPGTGSGSSGASSSGSSGNGAPMIACQLDDEGGKAVAFCGQAGEFAAGDPCETSAHCGAGLACVSTPSGGVCRAYCCDKLEDCDPDTYCAPRDMAGGSVKIPVCVPVKKCQPLDDSTCDMGQTCTVVRDDGTTSCVDLGAGTRGEGCPCASGYVCSKVNNTCLKLCHLGNDADCMGGTCQGGVMGYPEGIGICVGYP
ncbi:MAG: hypothetical protein U0359_08940 [Byssovorax sp.]